MPGLPGAAMSSMRRIVVLELPGERVFASPTADQEHLHFGARQASLNASFARENTSPTCLNVGAGLVAVVAGGVREVVAQRTVLVVAALVRAADDRVVRAAPDATLSSSAARTVLNGWSRNAVLSTLNTVSQALPPRLVLFRLAHELIEARLVVRRRIAAGELHEPAHGDVQVLRAEEPGAVGRQLALAVPLEQRELEGQQRDAGEEGQVADAHRQDDDRDRAVHGVPAHDVAELVGEDEPLLVFVRAWRAWPSSRRRRARRTPPRRR